MREDPGLDGDRIADCLEDQYGIRVASITFLAGGYDAYAAVYRVVADDGIPWFLKIRFGPIRQPGLEVPRALVELGVPNILAPLRSRSLDLWCPLAGYEGCGVVLYPFVTGEDAVALGLSDAQWREFGATLRAVHESGLGERFRGQLPVERFALPSAALVRDLLALIDDVEFAWPAATGLAAFWRANNGRIRDVLARGKELGRSLQAKSFDLVLCHADIHAANVLVGEDGRIWLVDWDEPLIAPRERDLLFVIGSRIARPVEPREEALFFAGYGPVEVDRDALVYYRYERIIQDLGEFGRSVFLDPGLGEQARAADADLAMSFFAPGGEIERAEVIGRS